MYLLQLPNEILESLDRISSPTVKSSDIKEALRSSHLRVNEQVRGEGCAELFKIVICICDRV